MLMPKKGKRILVVDDEPHVRQLVCRILGKEYAVLEASDGAEAVDLASTHKPDAIVMDMMMPRMDGLTACYQIKNGEATKGIPVVMLTAMDSKGNQELARSVWGADVYLTKPFTPQTLLDTVHQVLGGPA